ncbi:MAG: DUF4564 domain-containing protein [Desertifilum sp.]|nr:DUF4564 domain-containing protein [Desertifilum sp.]
MKILEQTSTRLVLQDSQISLGLTAFVCTPFLAVGFLGMGLAIAERIFPGFFVLFCLVVGLAGWLWVSRKTVWIDKSENKLTLEVKKLLSQKKTEYPLDELSVRVQKTSFVKKRYSSNLTRQREFIYVVILERPAYSQKIELSGNYGFNREQAVKIAALIQSFLTTPSDATLRQPTPDPPRTDS